MKYEGNGTLLSACEQALNPVSGVLSLSPLRRKWAHRLTCLTHPLTNMNVPSATLVAEPLTLF